MPKFAHTTKSEYRRFLRECRRVQHKLGLHAWRICYRHEPIADSYGDCATDLESRVAVIRFNMDKDPACPADMPEPERTARHEMLELLMARLRCICQSRWGSKQEMEEEIHAVIRTLENLI